MKLWRVRLIVIFFLTIQSIVSFATSSEVSTEFRVPLSQGGFNKLLSAQGRLPNTKTRKDIYFDIYSHSGFVLSNKGFKFRLKIKESSYALQLSKVLRASESRCGSIPIQIKKTESWGLKLSDKEGEKLQAKALGLLNDIEFAPKDLAAKITSFNRRLRHQSEDLLEPLGQLAGAGELLTSQWNQKIRFEIPYIIQNEELKALLGQIMDRDPDGQTRIRYEIEFEKSPKLDISNPEFTRQICSVFKLDQLTSKDFLSDEVRGDQFYFDRLKQVLP